MQVDSDVMPNTSFAKSIHSF